MEQNLVRKKRSPKASHKHPLPVDNLHGPDMTLNPRVRPQESHRLTPEARAFIVAHVTAGYSDREISDLLRKHGYIWDGEPDLSYVTFWRIRTSDDCLIDPDLFTPEARQIGHNILSRITVDMARLYKKAAARVLDGEAFGYEYPRISMADDLAAMRMSAQFLMDTFGSGIGERLRSQLEVDEATPKGQDMASLTPEQLARCFEGIIQASYTTAVRQIEMERHQQGTIEIMEGQPDGN